MGAKMSRKNKTTIIVITSAVMALIIAIGVWLLFIWGNTNIHVKDVSYDKINDRLNDVYVVNLPVDESEVSCHISFPFYSGGESDEKGFYPSLIHEYLSEPVSESNSVGTASIFSSSIIAGLPPSPYHNFDYNLLGHNEFANGYDIRTKDFDCKDQFSVKARKDMSHMESRGFISDYFVVKHYEFENVYNLNNQRLTYLYLDDTLHVSFMNGDYSFYVYFDYKDVELIKSDFDVMFAEV